MLGSRSLPSAHLGIGIPALPSSVALGNLIKLAKLQFSHPWNDEPLLRELQEIIHVSFLARCLVCSKWSNVSLTMVLLRGLNEAEDEQWFQNSKALLAR